MKIIVADDERITRRFLVRALTMKGHQVETAKDGDELVRLWKLGRQRVVISDLKMPNKNGFMACREIQSIDPGVKFVLITGGFYDLEDVRRLGIGPILQKPFSIEELLDQLGGG